MTSKHLVLTVDKQVVPLRRLENALSVTPERGEAVQSVAARLTRSSRLGLDATFAQRGLVVWGDRNKLDEIANYRDVASTRSVLQDPQGHVLALTDTILVRFNDGASPEDRRRLLRNFPGTVVAEGNDAWKIRVSELGPDAPLLLANELSAETLVDYAEPNALQSAIYHESPAGEPQFANQWHLENTGQGGGSAGADVDAIRAWAITQGSPSIAVVVHDSGVDITHPDLSANILPGWDFDNGDPDSSNPTGPHGTACAGVIAAVNNDRGVTGIAPGCRIVPLRAAGAHSWQSWADTFRWAASRGRVISCSWSITPNNTLSRAIRAAVQQNVVVLCATGNDARRTSGISYPASMAETIAVGASNNFDERSSYSQFGAGIDVVAPSNGGSLGIETTDIQGARGYNSDAGAAGNYCRAGDASGFGGTSSATPLAAGVVALMLSSNPSLTAVACRNLLRGSADKIDRARAGYNSNGWSIEYGFGRVNAARAVRRAQSARLVLSNLGRDAGGWRVDRHPRCVASVTDSGHKDLVGFGNAGVYVARGNGDGTFQPLQRVIDNFGHDAGGWRVDRHPRMLAPVAGRSRADIVGFGNAGVYVALSNSDGTFQAARRGIDNFGHDAGGWRVERHPRFLADVTGNGRADIVGFGNAGVYVALNTGDGRFQEPPRVLDNFGYDAGGWRVERHPRFLADVTGNGRADIIGFGNAGVYVALSNGDGTFQRARRVLDNFGYDAGGWRVERHPRLLADVTGDGRADIVGFGNAGVYVALSNGDGTFQEPRRVLENFGYSAGGWRTDQHPRFLADVTGDGRADIVGFGNAGAYVAFNHGDGTFAAPVLVSGQFGSEAGGWRVSEHPRFVEGLGRDGRASFVGFGNAGVYVRTVDEPLSTRLAADTADADIAALGGLQDEALVAE